MAVSVMDLKEATEYLRTFAKYISEASQLAVLYCIPFIHQSGSLAVSVMKCTLQSVATVTY